MNFIWGGEREKKNSRLCFKIQLTAAADLLTICAADSFQVFVDGNFVAYGPSRTAAGYSRPFEVKLNFPKEIVVKVISYNAWTYCVDKQLPFFAAEISNKGKVQYETTDFTCYRESSRRENMPRFSRQRGFTEFFDFTQTSVKEITTYAVQAPSIIDKSSDVCEYRKIDFIADGEGEFCGFDKIQATAWQEQKAFAPDEGDFDVETEFLAKVKSGYKFKDYHLEAEHSGFVSLSVETNFETKLFVIMDEYLPDGKLFFRRSRCNDFIALKVPKGKTEILSAEPYAFKYLKVLVEGEAKIVPNIVAVENDRADCVKTFGNEKFVKIFNAAKNTFRQNAIDIFMDCPGRERAGWLCDSYFTAQAELLFTGENKIEKAFLENFLIAETSEIPKNMVPKCFPGEHCDGEYIPNWAMWFAIECNSYVARSGDLNFKKRAKDKIYGVVEFFDKYLNEYGLLENLESWVFLEWSISNDPEYKMGISFPSNMLYAFMLSKVAELYADEALKQRADKIGETIIELAYNGSFFCENAVRKNGKICICKDHISETCQYNALFTGLCPDEEFKSKMKTEFGVFRKQDAYSEIGKSNMFIGNYLRLFWLCAEKDYSRVFQECVGLFSIMADKTGTLWEMNSPTSSCNHGFASVAAVLLLQSCCGYQTVKKGVPQFEDNFSNLNKLGVKTIFEYGESVYEKEF